MREEIEAAVTFLTRLLAKSVDPGGSSSSSTTTTSNGSITNNTGLVKETSSTTTSNNKNDHSNFNNHNNNHHNKPLTEDKIKKFTQKLIDILTQRYQNHWYPGQPSKGQAYRCIRINQNCRVDSSIEMACQHAGISYEALRLPVELTLWIDPSEVTCRFGEHKGSYCIVAKLGDGRQENFAESINIDELEQRSIDRSKQSYENPRLKMKPTHGSSQARLGPGHHVTSSAKQSRNQTAQNAGLMNPFASTTTSNSSISNSNVVSYHAMNGNSIPNGGITSQQNNHHITSHGSPVGNTLTNGFGLDYAAIGAATNGLPPNVFGPVGTGSLGSGTGGLPFHQAPSAAGSSGASHQPFQYQTYFNAFHQQANFPQQQQQAAAVAASTVPMHPSWSPGSHLFGTASASKYMPGLTGSPQQNPTSSTPPTSVAQLQAGGQSGRNSLCHLTSSLTGSSGFRSGQVNNSLTSAPVSTSSATSQVSTSKSNSQLSASSNVLTNGTLTGNSGSSPANNSTNSNTGGGANPNAPLFIPRHSFMLSHISAPPFQPASSLNNSFQSLDQSSSNGSNSTTVSSSISKDRRSFVNPNHSATSSSVSPSAAASTGATAAATATPLVANNRY